MLHSYVQAFFTYFLDVKWDQLAMLTVFEFKIAQYRNIGFEVKKLGKLA